MGAVDVITFFLSLVYIFLAIRNNYWCFIVAIAQCTLWAYLDFIQYQLIFDGLLQVFYILMALWGIYLWQFKKEKEELPISYVGIKWNIISIFAGFGLALLLGYFSSFFLEANMRYLDSVTTLFAIIATFMLVLRKVDNWIYFIFVDAAYIYIYTKAGSPFLAGVMIIYTLMAIYGYYSWHQKFIFSINSDR